MLLLLVSQWKRTMACLVRKYIPQNMHSSQFASRLVLKFKADLSQTEIRLAVTVKVSFTSSFYSCCYGLVNIFAPPVMGWFISWETTRYCACIYKQISRKIMRSSSVCTMKILFCFFLFSFISVQRGTNVETFADRRRP